MTGAYLCLFRARARCDACRHDRRSLAPAHLPVCLPHGAVGRGRAPQSSPARRRRMHRRDAQGGQLCTSHHTTSHHTARRTLRTPPCPAPPRQDTPRSTSSAGARASTVSVAAPPSPVGRTLRPVEQADPKLWCRLRPAARKAPPPLCNVRASPDTLAGMQDEGHKRRPCRRPQKVRSFSSDRTQRVDTNGSHVPRPSSPKLRS